MFATVQKTQSFRGVGRPRYGARMWGYEYAAAKDGHAKHGHTAGINVFLRLIPLIDKKLQKLEARISSKKGGRPSACSGLPRATHCAACARFRQLWWAKNVGSTAKRRAAYALTPSRSPPLFERQTSAHASDARSLESTAAPFTP